MGPREEDAQTARVAIVVTCFDDGDTLGETVASIRHGAGSAELVIVDDGSSDAQTLRVLSQLEEGGTRVIHQESQGPAAAGMAGVEATSAPYVMRFDSDDLLEAGAVDTLAAALDRAPEAALAWGDVQTFGISTFRIPGIRGLDAWLLTYTNCITGSGTLIRREALVEAGGWQLKEGWEDWDLWMALAEQRYEGVHVPRVVFRYRRGEGGRHAASLPDAESHYTELRGRHPALFARRAENRRRSRAPVAVKILVPVAEALPGIPRLTRIHLCELFTRLFWGGGLRGTTPMIWQAAGLRVIALLRNRTEKSPDVFRGQNQEDRFLAEHGLVPRRGVFVDVGAGDPMRYSNSLYLEQQGWAGLCIDADPRQVEALRRVRSCSVEWAAVTSADSEGVQFLQCDDPDYSTTRLQVSDAEESEGRKYTEIRVPGMRLETILEKHGVGRIDLLSIDVEGAELEACKSLDWQRHRPAVVVIEHTAAGVGSRERELRNYFAAMPYRLAQWTPENLILAESRLPRFLRTWSPRALLAKRKWHAQTVVGRTLRGR